MGRDNTKSLNNLNYISLFTILQRKYLKSIYIAWYGNCLDAVWREDKWPTTRLEADGEKGPQMQRS